MLIDSHAHLYLEQFDHDREEVIERAHDAGVEAILLPAVDAASIDDVLALCAAYPGYCYGMAGIHPSYVRDAADQDLDTVATALHHPDIVAVGETGIDYYWDRSFEAKQHDFLSEQARLAIEHDLPLVLHNRDKKGKDDSSRDLVRLLQQVRAEHGQDGRQKGVFHCFGPPRWLAADAMELGFFVGIGGTITYKKGGVSDAITDIPLDRIVLETDAPYLAPTPHRGQRNEPANVRLAAAKLAEVYGMSPEEVARSTTRNAMELFSL